MKEIFTKPFKDKDGQVVVFQRPNAWIIIWFVCMLLGFLVSSGWAGRTLDIIGAVALISWASLELFFGVNLFRRMLGLIVFGYQLLQLFR